MCQLFSGLTKLGHPADNTKALRATPHRVLRIARLLPPQRLSGSGRYGANINNTHLALLKKYVNLIEVDMGTRHAKSYTHIRILHVDICGSSGLGLNHRLKTEVFMCSMFSLP